MIILLGLSNLSARDMDPNTDPNDSIRIDKIEITKNWITWDRIVLKELLFSEGEWVRFGDIDRSMNRVWNIGSFANVTYSIDSCSEGNVLTLEAMDGVMFFPVIALDYSSKNEYHYVLGFADNNFLGSNSDLSINWDKRPTGTSWGLRLQLPRQLLYKNMTLGFSTVFGSATTIFWDRNILIEDGKKTGVYEAQLYAPYQRFELFAAIGNPWHRDYEYRFSPDLGLGYLNHEIDYSLFTQEETHSGILVPEETFRFFTVSVSESIGTINKKRHRKDGVMASASVGYFIGLNGTKSHQSFNIGGEYHKSLNRILQLSTSLNTGYVTADNHYRYSKGPGDVIGLRYGEIYGKAYYSAYLGSHFTWFNAKWLSLENAYFINWGNGSDSYSDLFLSKQKFSIGTFVDIRIPVAPYIAFRFTFMYAGPGSEWFNFVM